MFDTLHSDQYDKDVVHLSEQIGSASRIVKHDGPLDLIETPTGAWWVSRNDHILPFLLSEQRHNIYGTGIDGVNRGDVVLDCGANVGTFTKTALNRGARLVVAIEISPSAIECLRRNFAAEVSQGRVIIYPKGVWNEPTYLEMAMVQDWNPAANSVVFSRASAGKIRVPVSTVDLIVEELHLDRVDFVKMDIEGAEKQALLGATATIRHFRPRMAISSEHFQDDYARLPGIINSIEPEYRIKASDCYADVFSVRPSVLLCRFPPASQSTQ